MRTSSRPDVVPWLVEVFMSGLPLEEPSTMNKRHPNVNAIQLRTGSRFHLNDSGFHRHRRVRDRARLAVAAR